MANDSGFCGEEVIGSLLCRDPYNALSLLVVAISIVHILGLHGLHIAHLFDLALRTSSHKLHHWYILAEANFVHLYRSNISTHFNVWPRSNYRLPFREFWYP
jgi:hypothetical protein